MHIASVIIFFSGFDPECLLFHSNTGIFSFCFILGVVDTKPTMNGDVYESEEIFIPDYMTKVPEHHINFKKQSVNGFD